MTLVNKAKKNIKTDSELRWESLSTPESPPTVGEIMMALVAFAAWLLAPEWIADLDRTRLLLITLFVTYISIFAIITLSLWSNHPNHKAWQWLLWWSSPVPLVTTVAIWGYALLNVSILYTILCLRQSAILLANNRLEASQDAMNVIVTTPRNKFLMWKECDVYVPSQKCQNSDTRPRHAFLLFPGALTSRWAYAEIARTLASHDILTVVFNHEPFRMTAPIFGANSDTVWTIQSRVREEIPEHPVDSWSIGGHSMGAWTALKLVQEMQSALPFHSVVLWGFHMSWDRLTSPSSCSSSSSIHKKTDCLIVQADCDGFYFATSQAKEKWMQGLNRRNTPTQHVWLHTIRGGNHAGFASSDRHQMYPKPDGTRRISLEEQHKELIEVTKDFILRSR